LNCSIAEIDTLTVKLELFESVFSFIKMSSTMEILGSEENMFQFWKEKVKKNCSSDTCILLERIKDEVISFSPSSEKCSCSDN